MMPTDVLCLWRPFRFPHCVEWRHMKRWDFIRCYYGQLTFVSITWILHSTRNFWSMLFMEAATISPSLVVPYKVVISCFIIIFKNLWLSLAVDKQMGSLDAHTLAKVYMFLDVLFATCHLMKYYKFIPL